MRSETIGSALVRGRIEATTMLLVDDDQVFRERLARAFRDRGFEVRTAGDVAEAVAIARSESPELAVVDLRMPGRSGLDLVRELRSIDAATRIVVLTGYGSIATAIDATRLGATYYLPKPADVDDILAAFARDETGSTGASAALAPAAPSLARVEWEHINRVLADCDGNVSHAARRLGMHRRSLQRKLQKYPPRA
ncbi:MAG TPA: response regulator [Candidatus Binatia bacterium]